MNKKHEAEFKTLPYFGINKLLPYFKELLDDGKLALVLAVELSYLKENEQEQLVLMLL